jgi:hypothetical protein
VSPLGTPGDWYQYVRVALFVDLALTLALTETLALRDLIGLTGSPPELTPALLAPTFDARSPILIDLA